MPVMKTFFKCIAPALALLAISCTGGEKQVGKPFDELPDIATEQLWKSFAAIPKEDLPEKLQSPEYRLQFEKQLEELQEGMMGDGEGLEAMDEWYESDNSIYWSDYFTLPEDYDWSDEPDDAEHPYVSLNGYSNTDGTRIFLAVQCGSYDSEGNSDSGIKYYWYDVASGKCSAAQLPMDKPYTPDDLAEDTLLHYGVASLYYSLKDGKYYPTFYDRGFEVFIEDVGESGVRYNWDGTQFVKTEKKHMITLYSYGFSHIMLRDNMPFDIPGYQAVRIENDNEYECIYELRKDGESEPTLVFHTSPSLEIIDIELCTDRYANTYGFYPGMPYEDFLEKVEDFNQYYEEPPYLSVVTDMDENYAYVFWGYDEDFYYLVDKKFVKGDKIAPNAKIARVGVTAAVG